MSLPICLTVDGSQEPQACATVLWDNAFAEIHRTPFHVIDHVTWSRLAQVLQTKFKHETGGELTPENLNYLCRFYIVILYNYVQIKFQLDFLSRRACVPKPHQLQSRRTALHVVPMFH